MPIIVAILYAALVVLAVVAIDWRWPKCSPSKLVLIPSLPVPLSLLAVAVFHYVRFMKLRPASEIDAGAYVFLFMVMMPTVGAGIALVIGVISANLTRRYLRGRE